MATHSSVLAWRIPGTAEPGGLLSLGLHRVRHDWSDLAAAAAAYMCCFMKYQAVILSTHCLFPFSLRVKCSNELLLFVGDSGLLQAFGLEKRLIPLFREHLSWRRQWHPTPVLLPGKSHGRRSLVDWSMGSRRVGHDWATSLSLFTFMHWRRKWQPNPVFLPGESQGRGSLVGCRLWGRTESDTTEAA